jgi:hypothetical protein
MANFQKKTQKNVEFAKGGDTHMFGSQAAGPQDDATTAHDTSGDGGKFAKGGSTKMFGYAGSQPAEAGKTSAR